MHYASLAEFNLSIFVLDVLVILKYQKIIQMENLRRNMETYYYEDL